MQVNSASALGNDLSPIIEIEQELNRQFPSAVQCKLTLEVHLEMIHLLSLRLSKSLNRHLPPAVQCKLTLEVHLPMIHLLSLRLSKS